MKIKYLLFFLFFQCIVSCSKQEPNSNFISQNDFSPNDAIVDLNIVVDQEIPISNDIEMELYESQGDAVIFYEGKIERRGGFSIGFPKHSYKLDLSGDHAIANLPEDDDWILNANYIDKTFIRHRLSYELFSDMDNNNEAPLCAYANVELNFEYNGFYLLTERLDKSSLGINGASNQAVIFKEPPIFIEEEIEPQNPANYYQQVYPKIEELDQTALMEELKSFLYNSSESVFDEEVEQLFDINNVIDWHLLLLLSNNNDGVLKNFYLYKKDDGSQYQFAPWDYDHSFGRDGDNELNLLERVVNPERSILLKRLMERDWYRIKLKTRWSELNMIGLFSLDNLKNRVEVYKNLINTQVQKNYEIWPVDGPWYYDDNSFEQEFDIFNQYLELRHPQLIDYFDQL